MPGRAVDLYILPHHPHRSCTRSSAGWQESITGTFLRVSWSNDETVYQQPVKAVENATGQRALEYVTIRPPYARYPDLHATTIFSPLRVLSTPGAVEAAVSSAWSGMCVLDLSHLPRHTSLFHNLSHLSLPLDVTESGRLSFALTNLRYLSRLHSLVINVQITPRSAGEEEMEDERCGTTTRTEVV